MRGSSFRSRRRREAPVKLIAAGVLLLALAGGIFWFAHQAERRAPEPSQIEVEARNVGPS